MMARAGVVSTVVDGTVIIRNWNRWSAAGADTESAGVSCGTRQTPADTGH